MDVALLYLYICEKRYIFRRKNSSKCAGLMDVKRVPSYLSVVDYQNYEKQDPRAESIL
jgi:hypothetical protein